MPSAIGTNAYGIATEGQRGVLNGAEARAFATPQSGFSFRNKLINGCFRFWQRGTSQTSSGYGSADRWLFAHGGASTKTVSQQAFTAGQTAVPGNPLYFARTAVTSGNAVGSFVINQQRIEGAQTFAGETVTLSFWAKADAARSIAVEFEQSLDGVGVDTVNTIGSQKFSLTTSWQKFTATINIPSVAGKTLAAGSHLDLLFWLDAGTSYNARTGSLGNQSGTFDIAQVQLESGSVATPFEQRPYGLELSLCQRYFEFISPPGLAYRTVALVTVTNGTAARATPIRFVVPKRTDSLTLVQNGTFEFLTGGAYTSMALNNSTNTLFADLNIVGSGMVAGQSFVMRNVNDVTAYVAVSAEL